MTAQDDENRALIESLVGHTITRAVWFTPTMDWSQGEQCAWLYLDDGRVVEFGGYGYDAYGATVDEIDVRCVDACLACGAAHADLVVSTSDGMMLAPRAGLAEGTRYIVCPENWRELAWVEGVTRASHGT